jgi:hypothetical protein
MNTIGVRKVKELKRHMTNEFEDMNSADFVETYEEKHPGHVKLLREFMYVGSKVI